MREALRIFCKDARHLWWPRIAILWALLALQGWQDAKSPSMPIDFSAILLTPLLPLAAWFLIVSAIQEEALPGDRQYWLTRPLPRGSLLAAKALFVLAFLALPVVASQIAALAANGFPPGAFVLLLARKQVFFAAWMVLPAVALAAVTRNLVQVAVGALALAVLFILPLEAEAGEWNGIEPVRNWGVALGLIAIAGVVLALQYGRRRTFAARAVLACGTLAISLAYALPLPPGAATLESWFSPHPAVESGIRVAFDAAGLPKDLPRYSNVGPEELNIQLPLRFSGIPQGWTVRSEAVRMTVEGADGKGWHSSWRLHGSDISEDSESVALLPLSGAFYVLEGKRPAHVHARFAFTLIAPARSATLRYTSRAPVGIPEMQMFPRIGDSALCGGWQAGAAGLLVKCSAPLHHPVATALTGTTEQQVNWGGPESGFSAWRYSQTFQKVADVPVELAVRETASHFVRDVDLRDFRLDRCAIDFSMEIYGSSRTWWELLF